MGCELAAHFAKGLSSTRETTFEFPWQEYSILSACGEIKVNCFLRPEVPKGMRPFTIVFKTLRPNDELFSCMRDLGAYIIIDQGTNPDLVAPPYQWPSWAGPWAWATLWVSDYKKSHQAKIDELLIRIIDELGDSNKVGQHSSRNNWLDPLARPCALLTYEEDETAGRSNFEIRYGIAQIGDLK